MSNIESITHPVKAQGVHDDEIHALLWGDLRDPLHLYAIRAYLTKAALALAPGYNAITALEHRDTAIVFAQYIQSTDRVILTYRAWDEQGIDTVDLRASLDEHFIKVDDNAGARKGSRHWRRMYHPNQVSPWYLIYDNTPTRPEHLRALPVSLHALSLNLASSISRVRNRTTASVAREISALLDALRAWRVVGAAFNTSYDYMTVWVPYDALMQELYTNQCSRTTVDALTAVLDELTSFGKPTLSELVQSGRAQLR